MLPTTGLLRRCITPVLLIVFFIPGTLLAAPLIASPPKINSRAALVVDQTSGKILFQKNAQTAYPIASLTKMMTAVVVMESKQAQSAKLLVTNADRDTLKNTYSRLTIGSQLTRNDMLHIALMSSENRAASALSRAYPGGRAAFVRRMNLKARQLGMKSAHFADPTGLTPRNRASASDLLRLFNYAYRFPLLNQFSVDKAYTVFPGRGQLAYRSSNGLISNDSWHILQQKTGYTDQAGHCLVIRTRVGKHTYLIVILGGAGRYTHYEDAIDLKNWLSHRG